MRIDGHNAISSYQPARGRRRTGESGSFSASESRPGAARVSTHGASTLSGIDSMLALQGVEERDPREEGMRRGNQLLDILDELKVALLEGSFGGGRLDRLAALVGTPVESTGDAGLDDVIAAVDLRAQVELAKRGR